MSAPLIPRPALDAGLRAAVEAGPFLLTGPPGAGKTAALLGLGQALEREGWAAVYLDLMGAASSPDRFVRAVLDALPLARFGERLGEALEIRRLVDAGRPRHADAVRRVFALLAALDAAGGRPVALLLDEVTEIRSLAYFPGLRDVDHLLASALRERRSGTALATSYPTLARRALAVDTILAAPLSAEELEAALPHPARAQAEAVGRMSFGWPRYARVLIEGLAAGAPPAETWAAEMQRGGRLELMAHHTYEALLLRSRGYGMSKAVLHAVAREEGLNLKALVARLGRTPGATRDYLQWLVGVDALRMEAKRYHYVDGMVGRWVRIHASGVPATATALREAAAELLAAPAAGPVPPPTGAVPVRREDLIEID